MNLTELAFKYQRLVLLSVAILMVYGFTSYFTLPAQEDPQITIRDALVSTSYPGMSPERVEMLVTKKLEEYIRQIPEVKDIKTTSMTGQSIIHVTVYDRYFEMDSIWQDLRNKISDAQKHLPDGTSPSVVNDDYGDVAVITAALTSDGFGMGDMFDMAKHIRDNLYTVTGTKRVDIFGVQSERIYLEVSNAKLSQLGMSPVELGAALRAQNIIRPGGEIDTGTRSFVVEPTGNFETVKDIEETLISLSGTEDVIPLKDILDVKRGYIDPPHQPSYYNGQKAIIFAISMLEGMNVLEYSPRMKNKLAELQDSLPIGYQLEIATYQAEQVDKTVKGVTSNVLQTLMIVLLVVMAFLGARTGLIVGMIVPCVMLGSLAMMNVFGIDLERLSLATMIISLGLLVDNGIVIAEDFKSRLEQGQKREDVLKATGKELAMPLLSSSLTTILFFLPLMLADHVAGEYTRSVSLLILITLMTSWVLALCVTPICCYHFLKINPKGKEKNNSQKTSGVIDKIYAAYTSFLKCVLRFRSSFLILMFAMLIGSGYLLKFVPKQFFPDSDREQVLIYVELPTGTTTRTTDLEMNKIFSWLSEEGQFPNITSHAGYVGFGGPRFVLSLSPEDPASNKGFIVANIDDFSNIDKTIKTLREGFVTEFPHIFVRVKKMFLGASESSVLEIQVKGPDAEFIYNKAQEIADKLQSVPGSIDVRTNWENRTTKIFVQVDQQRARRSGITSEDVAISLQSHFSGNQVTEYREKDDIIPVVYRAEGEERFNLDRLRTINVYSASRGINVPLFQIADFEADNQFSRIERDNLSRAVTVEAKNLQMTAEDLKLIMDPILDEMRKDLPLNHQINYDGVITDSKDAQSAMAKSVPLCLGLVILLLVSQFNSYRRAAVIMLTIPLALIGAVIGMLVTGSFFGFMVTLGLYSLAGIIINNAIVLIDRIDIEQAEGKTPYDAIIAACVKRLRPIAMATITTVLGLLPLIISRDPLFYGMANAMAFGLAIGTVLTLGVVPALYAIMFKVKKPS